MPGRERERTTTKERKKEMGWREKETREKCKRDRRIWEEKRGR